MKFMHIADVHLGMKPDINYKWSKEREEDIQDTFVRIIELCNREKIEMLLITGDMFHMPPMKKNLMKVNDIFKKLINTKVVLIAGSNDYFSVSSNINDFMWNSNVFVLKDSKMGHFFFQEFNTVVYGYSYHERYKNQPFTFDENLNKDKINILLAYGGDKNYTPMDFDLMESYGFDYIALGHRHNFEMIGRSGVYPGTPEPLNRMETGEHGVVIGNITKDRLEFQLVPFSKRQYITQTIILNSSMTNDSIRAAFDVVAKEKGKHHIYSIILDGVKNPDFIPDYEEIFKGYHIIHLEDKSFMDFNFQVLYEENRNNLMGLYIERVNKMDVNEEIRKRTLHLGMEVLRKS